MDVKNEVLGRIYIVFLVVFLVAIVILGKVIKIQYVEGDKWRQINKELHLDYKEVVAERGDILADNGERVVTSLVKYDIHMDLASTGMTDEDFENNVDSLGWYLSQYVDKTWTHEAYIWKLKENRKKGNRYFKIKNNIDFNLLQKIKNFPLFKKGKNKGGLIVEKRNERARPYGRLARRTFGVDRDNAQDIGLEGYFDTQLKGEVGKQLMQRIKNNVWIPVNDIVEIKSKKGDDIYSTINIQYQDIAESALEKALKLYQAKQGCAVIMDVETGAIKAISNLGTVKDGYAETYNFAIGTSVEPGSTFKLATMMSLMEDFSINLNDTINIGDGTYEFHDKVMKDASFHDFEKTSVRHSFEISSNVAMAKLVEMNYNSIHAKDGAKKFISNFKKWHLHKKNGVEIVGEGQPLVKNAYDADQGWSGITLPWMAIGYETRFTPLQMLTFYNGVANNGKMMRPFLVNKIKHTQKNTWTTFEPVVMSSKMASGKTISRAKDLLRGVVVEGTAKEYNNKNYDFAGKTGTVQKNYWKQLKQPEYMSSFVGYFPSEKPKYSCIVWVDEPVGAFYGSKVALPVFAEISKNICRIDPDLMFDIAHEKDSNKKILPTYTIGNTKDLKAVLQKYNLDYVDNSTEDHSVLTVEDEKIILKDRTYSPGLVPSVIGLDIKDAFYVLENIGLKVKFSGVGKVVTQSIKAGTKINNQTIYLDLKMKKG